MRKYIFCTVALVGLLFLGRPAEARHVTWGFSVSNGYYGYNMAYPGHWHYGYAPACHTHRGYVMRYDYQPGWHTGHHYYAPRSHQFRYRERYRW